MSGPQPQLRGSARDSVSGRDATRSKSLAETKKGRPQNWSHVRREGLRLRPPRTRGVTQPSWGPGRSWTAGVREGPGPCVKTELGQGLASRGSSWFIALSPRPSNVPRLLGSEGHLCWRGDSRPAALWSFLPCSVVPTSCTQMSLQMERWKLRALCVLLCVLPEVYGLVHPGLLCSCSNFHSFFCLAFFVVVF